MDNDLKWATFNFKFNLTLDEAKAVIEKPKSRDAQKLKKYFQSILQSACQKYLEKQNEDVKNCKVDMPKRLT